MIFKEHLNRTVITALTVAFLAAIFMGVRDYITNTALRSTIAGIGGVAIYLAIYYLNRRPPKTKGRD